MGDWFSSFLSLFFPRCCLVCGGPLAKGEECLCTRCNIGLPRTGYHRIKNNLVYYYSNAWTDFKDYFDACDYICLS